MTPGAPRSERLLAHLRECVAAAERVPSTEDLVAAEMLLAERPKAVQRPLFNTAPPTQESCPGTAPSLQAGRRGSSVGR
jgi:hypothetical protein